MNSAVLPLSARLVAVLVELDAADDSEPVAFHLTGPELLHLHSHLGALVDDWHQWRSRNGVRGPLPD